MKTVTNEGSIQEEGVSTSLSNGPGRATDADHLAYYNTLLRIWWGTTSPREARRLRKKEPLMVDAIEGILKHGR